MQVSEESHHRSSEQCGRPWGVTTHSNRLAKPFGGGLRSGRLAYRLSNLAETDFHRGWTDFRGPSRPPAPAALGGVALQTLDGPSRGHCTFAVTEVQPKVCGKPPRHILPP